MTAETPDRGQITLGLNSRSSEGVAGVMPLLHRANPSFQLYIALLCGLAAAGCGPNETPQPKMSRTQPSVSNTFASLPATVEGTFALSVEKGDVDEKGVSQINFGTLTVNGVEHLVQVSGAVLRASALPRDGGKVRATFGSRTDQYGAPTFIITAMEKL